MRCDTAPHNAIKYWLGNKKRQSIRIHLERQARPDLFLQDLGNRSVKVRQDLHGQLGIDAVLGDQVIEGVRQGGADAARRLVLVPF